MRDTVSRDERPPDLEKLFQKSFNNQLWLLQTGNLDDVKSLKLANCGFSKNVCNLDIFSM